MPRLKVLLTVTTYPLPSKSYDELVCTAGITEDGRWIRIYPIPLSFLKGLKRNGILQPTKYSWITLDLKERSDDFRPETHSPFDYEFKDLVVGEHLGTEGNWKRRKDICLQTVWTNLTDLIKASKDPNFTSLATFKPSKILGVDVEEVEENWDPVYAQLDRQLDMFDVNNEESKEVKRRIEKVPFKIFYRFEDDAGRKSRLMIEDWEIGALYWNALRRAGGDKEVAVQKVKQKYEDEFLSKKDIYLFLGTTKQWHARKAKNPFVIIGVFYPKIEKPDTQGKLF